MERTTHASDGPAKADARALRKADPPAPAPELLWQPEILAAPTMQGSVLSLRRIADPTARRAAFRSIQRTFGNGYAAGVAAALNAGGPKAIGIEPQSGAGPSTILRDHSPTTTPTARPGYDPTPEQARNGLIAALGGTALGQKAAAVFNKNGVGIIWEDKGTAGFEDARNAVHLNRKIRSHELASYFVHEMHHAQQFHAGVTKMPENSPASDKTAWVNSMVNEEIEANFLQFEEIYQAGDGGKAFSGLRPDLPPQFVRVRKDWIARHLKEHPGDQEGAEKVSQAKGKALIKYWFERPTPSMSPSLAPNQFQTYREYYEGLFNAAHKAQSIPATTGGSAAPAPSPTTENQAQDQIGHDEKLAIAPEEGEAESPGAEAREAEQAAAPV